MRGTPHYPRCVTSLSSHEVALGYRENTPDPSVFIKFKVDSTASASVATVVEKLGADKGDVYLIAWTTTPWTIPANRALAYNKSLKYVVVEINDQNDFNKRKIIVAKDLLENVVKECEIKDFKIINEIRP